MQIAEWRLAEARDAIGVDSARELQVCDPTAIRVTAVQFAFFDL
jgi:hypothetical protein